MQFIGFAGKSYLMCRTLQALPQRITMCFSPCSKVYPGSASKNLRRSKHGWSISLDQSPVLLLQWNSFAAKMLEECIGRNED
ncbi:hypothetical protein M514_07955 [Trichuris suis]|uniref:Uncharacterized protein n=1 Tax=Trichuris suis TaxID=68888 RepID=A0A085NIW1_9BILA|nr:hypothetical protein M514_07955 [Trichuris suis]